MEINGVVKSANNDELTLKIKDGVNVSELKKHAVNGNIYGYFEVYEKDTMTDLQRRHFYALMRDYETYTGVPLEHAESWFKYQFMQEEALSELPSLARNQMKKKEATKLLTFVITYMIQNDIPFQKQQFYLTLDQSKMLFALIMKRLCFVCGKPHSDIHHATNLVGQSNNRKTHDHWNSTYMSLCRRDHNVVHELGLTEFMKKYFVKPVKLNKDQLKELGVM